MMNSIRTQPTDINLPAELSVLEEIACNLWWSWSPTAQALFREIDPQHWHANHNPVRLLREVEPERLQTLAADGGFRQRLQKVQDALHAELSRARRIGIDDAQAKDHLVVYLCTEFGVHECLPIYSGGLGVLAGDHTKSASDLGVPFLGIGLLYKNGYFRQEIDAEGNQHELFVEHDFANLPLRKVLTENEQPLRIRVGLPGREVLVQAWLAEVGRVALILLDTDVEGNSESDRQITSQLYGGDREMRIMQEIVLGIGGVRVLRALGMRPAAWHLNEGHVAFSLIERTREYMQEQQLSFQQAKEAVRRTTVFTTHTPVPAGNEAFSIPLIDRYFRHFCNSFDINVADFIRLGVQTGEHGEKFFSMTVLALHLSCVNNGVSALHGEVSQKMWAHLWPQIPHNENPITSITNGVHTHSWMAPAMADFLAKTLGSQWPEQLDNRDFWQNFRNADPEALRELRRNLKTELFAYVRERLRAQYQRHGAPPERLQEIESWLDPDALTIGFARRFATYKRAMLIFKDFERLKNLINHSERPVQLIFAGKAHPADGLGQELIKEIWRISQLPEFLGKVIILENYDMRLGRALVQGVDLWLNNPRRPLEASGTSGQKVPLNGGINFSVLDGWWPEAYNGENGWKIGRTEEYDNDEVQDYEDAYSLYETLENTIIPLYYGAHDLDGKSWQDFAKASLATTVPVFNTEVMVRNYYRKMYRVAIDNAREFEKSPQSVSDLARYKQRFRDTWPLIHFTAVQANVDREAGTVDVRADLYIGELQASEVTVELYCEQQNGNGEQQVQVFALEHTGEIDATIQQFALQTSTHMHGEAAYKLRVLPNSEALTHRNELGLIYWQDLESF